MKILKRTQFGNRILRQVAERLTNDQILSDEIQNLIKNIYHTVEAKKTGVGLAAPQVGQAVAIAVVAIKPTPTRPNLERQNLTLINPEIIKTYGKRIAMWEGCISGPDLFAKALRYKQVTLRWQDASAEVCEQTFDGFIAHVIQHEVDHLNGLLFVDRVRDTKTYMTASEYKKMRSKQTK